MSTDLFLLPTAPPSPSNGIQGDKSGRAGLDRSNKTRSGHESSDTKPDDFFNTLKKVSQDHRSGKRATPAGVDRPIEKPIVSPDKKTEASIDVTPSEDVDPPLIHDSDPVQKESDLDSTAFMNALAVMGIHSDGGEFGTFSTSNLNTPNRKQLAEIKTWFARYEQNPVALTVDFKAVVKQLQQAIAGDLNGKGVVPPNGNVAQEPGARILAEVGAGTAHPRETGGWNGGNAVSNLETVETLLTGSRTGMETTVKSSAIRVNVSNQDVQRSSDTTMTALPSDNRGDRESAKKAGLTRQTGTESRLTLTAPSMSTVSSDTQQSEKTPHLLHRPRIGEAANLTRGMADKTDLPAEYTSGVNRNNQTSRWTATASVNPALTSVSAAQIHGTVGEEPVSRIFQDIQLDREAVNRIKVDLNDEPSGKVIKSEAAANDNSLLNSSGQSGEKNAEVAATAKETDAGQGMSRNQTLDQIVRKAAIHLRNGQHEVRIDLKPDFLGHVRMQVISENHQVTVKILAEYGFVKDMLENNLHQLKADLQQQGLEVDKVEVSVSQDTEDGGNSKGKLAQPKLKQSTGDPRDLNRVADEHEKEPRRSGQPSDASAIVDYFA